MPTDLLTGFPGFIGRRLATRLLEEKGVKLVALVEPRMAEAATAAAAEIDPKRIEVLAGDISERRLALADADWDRLTKDVRRVYHLAAIYDLAVPIEVAQRVNVDGTGNVLELCAAAKKLERLAYVSTAYVAGRRRGVVYEHELVMGQEFKNHYESTKFQAEVWVREEMADVPTTILRPAIVVGDSQTGETQKFDGPVLHPARHLRRPSGWAARWCSSAAPAPTSTWCRWTTWWRRSPPRRRCPRRRARRCTWWTPSRSRRASSPARWPSTTARPPPKGRIPPALVEASLRIPAVRARFGNTPRESIAYLNHPVRVRHAAHGRPARREGAHPAALRRLRRARWCATSASTRTTAEPAQPAAGRPDPGHVLQVILRQPPQPHAVEARESARLGERDHAIGRRVERVHRRTPPAPEPPQG